MFVVFLNSKLISCDTILPLMMELHQRTGRRVKFLVHDLATLDAIRLNRYLWEAISEIGDIQAYQRRRPGFLGWLSHRAWIAALLLRLAALGWLGGRIFHFRTLTFYPLRFVTWGNVRRTIVCESDSYGEPPLMAKVGGLGVNRRVRETPVAGHILAFSPYYQWLVNPATAGRPRTVFGPTRTRKVWLDFVKQRLDRGDWAAEFERAGHSAPERAFVFMLGYFGYPGTIETEPEDLPERLFGEALDALYDVDPETPVVLKPHVFTDMKVVERQLAARPHLKAVISYLHPTALALRAHAVVSNLYSTTQADAKALGTPTVEISAYSDEALELSGGGSMNPEKIDHFVQRDPEALRAVLRDLRARVLRTAPAPSGEAGDPTGFLHGLAEGDLETSAQ